MSRPTEMVDCVGRELEPGDYALMYTEYRGRQMVVQIIKYNPDTGKMSVERMEEVKSQWQRKQFSTNYYSSKLYKLEPGYYMGNNEWVDEPV